jgi:hypothetical protein
MLKRRIGLECVNPACQRQGELVNSVAVCEECGSPLKPIEKWNWRALGVLGLLVIAGAAGLYKWRGAWGATTLALPPPPTSQPATSQPSASAIPAPAEITLSYAFEMGGDDRIVSMVASNRVFRSGDRFRVVLKSDFHAWVYLFNQNPDDSEVQVLFPFGNRTAEISANNETRAPGTEGWFRMDRKTGNEVLILVASPAPVSGLHPSGGRVQRRDFDSWLARTEEVAKPQSQRLFENAPWTSLMADASQTPLVFVQRVPLKHE